MARQTQPPATGAGPRTPRQTRVLAVLGAAAATLTVWAAAGPLAGIDLTVRMGPDQPVQQVGPVAVVLASAAAGLAGWALLALLERLTPRRARTAWTVVAAVALLLSLTGPLAATTAGAGTALAGMHLAAAAVLVPVLSRSAAARR
jgi:Family of unknown function (DUF6069)